MGYKLLPVDPAADATCACPVCGAEYSIAEIPCRHFAGDWCFTTEYHPGCPRGQWATTSGEEVLTEFDSAIKELEGLLDNREWRSERERRQLLASLPKHLRNAIGGWGGLLDDRITAAPGYLGTHEIVTASMAGDAWSVHWAEDGPETATAVEKLFAEDLRVLRAALERARAAVLPE